MDRDTRHGKRQQVLTLVSGSSRTSGQPGLAALDLDKVKVTLSLGIKRVQKFQTDQNLPERLSPWNLLYNCPK